VRNGFFILTGEPGVGKSAIAAHLIQNRKDIVAYHFCQLGVAETVHPSRVLRSLAAQLDQSFPYYSEALFNTIKSTLSGEAHINIDKIEDLEDEFRAR
jgi:AAA+ ATPase superfamily predicted ATPase